MHRFSYCMLQGLDFGDSKCVEDAAMEVEEETIQACAVALLHGTSDKIVISTIQGRGGRIRIKL